MDKIGREWKKNMTQEIGRQSMQFQVAPHIISAATIVSKKEKEGPIGMCFERYDEDDMFGMETWEAAESEMQKRVCKKVLDNAGITPEDVRYLFGGDLLRQGIATSLGVEQLHIPLFGLYGACSTSGEALALSAMTVAGGYGSNVLAVTSSHFASAEKEFRFPLLYANQRPLSSQWTVTGSGAFIIGTKESKVKIPEITIGKIVDYGLKEAQNMGACMAPAAVDTIKCHLSDLERQASYYDKIITGDLGYIGSEILIEFLQAEAIDISGIHLDCGKLIYDPEKQKTHAGGSGCGCAATTLGAYVLPKLESGEWKRVLFVPTGALQSTVSFNEGQSIPAIAHAIVLEHHSID